MATTKNVKTEKEIEATPSSTKDFLKEQAEKGTKIKLRDRIKCVIVKETKHYKKGQVITPHKIFGEKLIKEKIAKKFEEE